MAWGYLLDTDKIDSDRIGGALCEKLSQCPFCGKKPQFKRWEGRELIILKHKCRWVDFDSTSFREKLHECVDEWNQRAPNA